MTISVPAVVAHPPTAIEPVKKSLVGQLIERIARPKTSPARLPYGGTAFVTNVAGAPAGVAMKENAGLYRAWAQTELVFSAISMRRNQVSMAEWDIVPFDSERSIDDGLRREIRDLFETPNRRTDSYMLFSQMLVEDLLVLDAGAIEKIRYPTGEIAELWPTPGEWVGVNTRWDGTNEDEPRYFWIPQGSMGIPQDSFKDQDFIYLMQNPRTISAVGLSPIEVLRMSIDSELQTTEYNRRMVMGAAPDGTLNIGEDAPPEKVQEARAYWQTEILGRSAMAIIGGFKSPSFIRFRDTNREMQFREWQDYLVRKIAIVMGLSPQDLGITWDVNRSTADTQSEHSEDRGLRPLMAVIQSGFTREVVWDKGFGGKENNLAFRYTSLNIRESLNRAQINKLAMGGISYKVPNEARRDDGRLPVGALDDDANIFNHILIPTPIGILDLNTQRWVGGSKLNQTPEAKALARELAEEIEIMGDRDG